MCDYVYAILVYCGRCCVWFEECVHVFFCVCDQKLVVHWKGRGSMLSR
jgi:hypothetical protein